jgi:uncharacterized membrane protein
MRLIPSPTLAALHIGDPQWLWPAAGLLLCALVILGWGYRQARGGRATFLPALLKTLALAALAAFLLNPLWSAQRAQPRANLFVTLVDNSKSLRVNDRGKTMTRADALRQTLTGSASTSKPAISTGGAPPNNPPAIAAWSLRLAENFDSRLYAFDTRLHSLDDASQLTFDGRGSSLLTSLRAIADRYKGRPLAGVLLLTDGNATDLDAPGSGSAGGSALDLTGLPPVYPVVLGSDTPAADLGIASLAVSQTAFEDAPVTVAADVSAIGYAGRTFIGELLDETDKVVKTATMKVDGDDKTIALRFQVKPEKSGVSFYRLRLRAEPTLEREAASGDKEATTENNTRVLAIDRGKGPYRVLYVSGRPNWEFKFLNRAIAADPQMQLTGLIRLAKREARFAWRDNVRDAVNPLFKGFDPKDKEQVESYDEPVLVRVNTIDDAELRSGFPKYPADLFKYHAVVLDDLEAAFFTRDQLALLERFVTERQGGLLMLGGAESLREGDYHRTPLGRLLPVYLDRAAEGGSPSAGVRYRFDLTRPGQHEPWARLRGTEDQERQRLASMPAFLTVNRIPASGIKPGATVIAEAVDDAGGRWPALITQPFGGRVAVLAVGDQWRWALKREADNDDAAKMWRQTMRWLVAEVPGPVTAAAEPTRREADPPMKISVRLRDKDFKALDNATVKVTITPPSSAPGATGGSAARPEPIDLRAEASLSEPGLYEATYLPRIEGAYRAAVSAVGMDGKPAGTADLGWASGDSGDEMRSLKPNRALLEAIAKQTGGSVIDADDLDSFVAGLPSKRAPVMETTIEPLWHRWWALVVALSLLAGEWALRRVRGLP